MQSMRSYLWHTADPPDAARSTNHSLAGCLRSRPVSQAQASPSGCTASHVHTQLPRSSAWASPLKAALPSSQAGRFGSRLPRRSSWLLVREGCFMTRTRQLTVSYFSLRLPFHRWRSSFGLGHGLWSHTQAGMGIWLRDDSFNRCYFCLPGIPGLTSELWSPISGSCMIERQISAGFEGKVVYIGLIELRTPCHCARPI